MTPSRKAFLPDGKSLSRRSTPLPRWIFAAIAAAIGVLTAVQPSFAKMPSSQRSLSDGLVLYQMYTTATACTKVGLYFTSADMDTIKPAIQKRVTKLDLLDEESAKLWAAAQKALQLTPLDAELCFGTRQWVILNLPEVSAQTLEERPF